jgi:hypothetical protein
MGIVVRRIRRAIGWGGVCYVILAVICIVALLSHVLPVSNVEAWRLILLPIAGLAVLGYRMRGYQKPQVTRSYEEVLTPLLASAEEFCLVLRPFGQDGETFLRKYRKSKRNIRHVDPFPYADILTMEQVIARSAHQALRLDTYALVDQNRKLAPPGPVYVRARNESWQEAVLALVQRAHSIILWLAPGQDLRASFDWEIEQIVQARRQFRTIIVLPPPDQQADAYRHAVDQATVLLATLDSVTGKLADADAVHVRHYQDMLGDNTLMAKLEVPAEGGNGAVLRRWYATGRRKWWGGKMPLDVSAYEKGLAFLITRTEGELADQPFIARYPSRQPDDQDRTAAERQ